MEPDARCRRPAWRRAAQPTDLPPGCAFHPRCPEAMAPCRSGEPPGRAGAWTAAMSGAISIRHPESHCVRRGRVSDSAPRRGAEPPRHPRQDGPQAAPRTMTREQIHARTECLAPRASRRRRRLAAGCREPGRLCRRGAQDRPEQDGTTFDPILTIQNVDIWVMDNMNAGLVRVTNDGTGLEPDLAESWTVSPDAQDLYLQAARRAQILRRQPAHRPGREVQPGAPARPEGLGDGQHVQGRPEDRCPRRQDRRRHPERAVRAVPVDARHVRRLGGAAEGGDREGRRVRQ